MMKVLRKGFVVSALFLLVSAIPTIGQANPDPNYIKILSGGQKVKLTPHGFDANTPSQDTANLQWIFQNYSHSDIQLDSGTFHISETIEVAGYQGKIKGNGSDSTFLVGRGPLVNGQYEFPLLNLDLKERFFSSGVPCLFWFHALDGDVNQWQANKLSVELKDFTVRLDGVGPEITLNDQPFRSIWSLMYFTGKNALFTEQIGNVPHIELKVKNVHFQAQEVPYVLNGDSRSNTNAAAAIVAYGSENWVEGLGLNGWTEIDHSPVNAQVEIKDSQFDGFHQFAIALESLFTSNPGTSYTFPTNPVFPQATASIKNNRFTNIGNGAGIIGSLGFNLLFLALSEAEIEISNNDFQEMPSGGLVFLNNVAESMPKITSHVSIKDNNFDHASTSVSGSSVTLLDFGFFLGPHYDLDINDNKFIGAQGFNKSFIEIGMGTGASIRENDFNGVASSAISIGNTASPLPPNNLLPATNCDVAENNFLDLTSSVANIVLGQGSVLNTVQVDNASDVSNSGQFNTIIVE